MSNETCRRVDADEEPEEGEIQDDDGSLEDVSSDDDLVIAKRQKSEVYAPGVRLHGPFGKAARRLSRASGREMRLCSSEKSDTASKKYQATPRSSSRTTGMREYLDAQRYKSSKELIHKVSGKVHEKENKVKDVKKAKRRSASFHSPGEELRSSYIASERAELYFSSTSSRSWQRGDIKEKHRKKKKNSKSNKTNNPLVEVYESQLKSTSESSSVNQCAKLAVTSKEVLSVHQKETEVVKEKSQVSPQASSDIEILDVPVTIPEVITIFDSDEDVLKKTKEENNIKDNMTSAKEGSGSDTVPMPFKEKQQIDSEEHEDNLKLLREAALNSSKPEKCVTVNRDDEVLQLRLEALRSAIMRKYEERKKRGLTLAKTSKSSDEKNVMSISPLGSPNHCSSGDSSNYIEDAGPNLHIPINDITNHGIFDLANDCEVDKISTIDMELVESDEEKEQMHTESVDISTHVILGSIERNLEGVNSNSNKVDNETAEEETREIIDQVSEHIASVPSRSDSSQSLAQVEIYDAPLGYIIGDQEQTCDFVQESHESLLSPVHFLNESQSEIGDIDVSGNKDNVEKHEIISVHQSHTEVPNNQQICSNKQNNLQCNLSDGAIGISFQSSVCGNIFGTEITQFRNDEDDISRRSECSNVSSASVELDIESMIILDEVDGCSDDTKSEGSEREVICSEKFQNSPSRESWENTEVNAEQCDEKSEVVLNGLLCNERTSDEIAKSKANQIQSNLSMGKVCGVALYSRSPPGCDAHDVSVNLRACKSSQELEDNSHVGSDMISSLSSSPVRLCVHTGTMPSYYTATQHIKNVSVCEKTDVCRSKPVYDTDMRISNPSSNSNINVNLCVSQEESKFSSGENIEERVNSDNVKGTSCYSLQKTTCPVFIAKDHVLTDTGMSSSLQTEEQVHKPDQEEKQCSSIDALQLKEYSQCVDTFSNKGAENTTSIGGDMTEDEENVLRVSLLAMLKKRANELNNKQKRETNISEKDNVAYNHSASPSNLKDCSVKKAIPIVPHVTSFITDFSSSGSCKNNDKSNVSVLRPLSVSQSYTAAKQASSIHPISKNVVYPSHTSHPAIRLGAKASKRRIHDTKTHRYNVNVPKLVINLGEDSDSGEEDKFKPVDSVSISKITVSEVLEESRSSQPVPPDFEKKLDMLLKQARFQQETSTKEDGGTRSEITNENLPILVQSKTVTCSSKNSDSSLIENLYPSGGSSSVHKKSIDKVPLVVVTQTVADLQEKNMCSSATNKNKKTCDSSVDMTKLSPSRKVESRKQDIRVRAKHTSTIASAKPSVSSVVDIGLLPSCKQKEYIQLKKQLAQLARKETEVKANENITLVNISRLPMKKNGMEEAKLQTSSVVRSNNVRNTLQMSAERSPFSRKFVRRGQGGAHILRNEFNKSRRIVRTASNLSTSQLHLRNRLTVTAPNRGSVSAEGTSLRRVLCMPQKRIVTATPSAKKVSSGIQATNPNNSAKTGEKPKRVHTLIASKSAECVSAVGKTHFQVKCNQMKDNQDRQTSESVSSSIESRKVGIKKSSFATKRKGSESVNSEMIEQKKIAVHQDHSNGEQQFQFQTNTDSVNINEKEVNDDNSNLNSNIKESTPSNSTRPLKKKKDNSNQNDVLVQKLPVLTQGTLKEQIMCIDYSNEKATGTAEIGNTTVAEGLWSSENKLISKRYEVLEDIATVKLSLHEIEKVSEIREQINRNIQRLKEELCLAETHLGKKDELLKILYSGIETTKRDIMRKQSETLLLSIECEEIGCKVHGSNYNIPNTCTDLIRTGMGTVSKILEQLKTGKSSVDQECDVAALCSSGEQLPNAIDTTKLKRNELSDDVEEISDDTNKQSRGSYLSPLEAIKTGIEPNSDNQTVLCPYHIMGSCKDKECSYLH